MTSQAFRNAMGFPDDVILADDLNNAGARLESALVLARKNPHHAWKYLPRIRELLGLLHRLETVALSRETPSLREVDMKEIGDTISGMFVIE